MKIAVLIPSYRRPHVLRYTMPSWAKGCAASNIVVVADTPMSEELQLYEKVLRDFRAPCKDLEVTYELYKGRRGSVNARNRLLELAQQLKVDYAVMADDDYILPNPQFLVGMAKWFAYHDEVGAVGGRVEVLSRRAVDPDFFLKTPVNLADALTKLTGFVFLDVRHGPRYAEFLTPFYMVRRELVDKIRYVPLYRGTAYREESDVHLQIKSLGWKLLFDPRYYVIHLAFEEGGNRLLMTMSQRIYWKARNHTIYTLRWNTGVRRVWRLASGLILLLLYRPWHLREIHRGVTHGLYLYGALTHSARDRLRAQLG